VKHFVVAILCAHCGADRFQLSRAVDASSLDSLVIHETMSHPGFGWDLDRFEVTCAKCGSKNKIKVEIEVAGS
jgi:hypothetical protein